jgi:hypothetical protein
MWIVRLALRRPFRREMNNGSAMFRNPVEKITGDRLVSGNSDKDHFSPRMIFKFYPRRAI